MRGIGWQRLQPVEGELLEAYPTSVRGANNDIRALSYRTRDFLLGIRLAVHTRVNPR